jgi:type VI secretion system protein
MHEERLLERIRDIERNPDRRGAVDSTSTVQSVMAHLRRILNTRQGTALIAEDFGVPDFTNLGSTFGQDTIPDIQKAITEVIRKYEPRLHRVDVTYQPQAGDELGVFFKLEGSIDTESKSIPVVFETVIDPDGKVRLKT